MALRRVESLQRMDPLLLARVSCMQISGQPARDGTMEKAQLGIISEDGECMWMENQNQPALGVTSQRLDIGM